MINGDLTIAGDNAHGSVTCALFTAPPGAPGGPWNQVGSSLMASAGEEAGAILWTTWNAIPFAAATDVPAGSYQVAIRCRDEILTAGASSTAAVGGDITVVAAALRQ